MRPIKIGIAALSIVGAATAATAQTTARSDSVSEPSGAPTQGETSDRMPGKQTPTPVEQTVRAPAAGGPNPPVGTTLPSAGPGKAGETSDRTPDKSNRLNRADRAK